MKNGNEASGGEEKLPPRGDPVDGVTPLNRVEVRDGGPIIVGDGFDGPIEVDIYVKRHHWRDFDTTFEDPP